MLRFTLTFDLLELFPMRRPLLLLAILALPLFAVAERINRPIRRVFELRTYYAAPGKLDALHARFRDHTCKLFEKHGMTNIGYWIPNGPEDGEPRLVYIIAHKSRDAAKDNWKAFGGDPDWQSREESLGSRRLSAGKPESVFLKPTDYSPLK